MLLCTVLMVVVISLESVYGIFSQASSATTGTIPDDELEAMFQVSFATLIKNNRAAGIGCVFDITKLEDAEPLYLEYPSGKKLLVPDNGIIRLAPGQAIFADCLESIVDSEWFASPSESLRNPLTIVCLGNQKNQFLIYRNGKQGPIEQKYFHRCFKKDANVAVLNTRDAMKCLGGDLMNIGFNGDKGFIHYYDICYNLATLSPIYSKHYIFGQSINKAMPARIIYIKDSKGESTRESTFYVEGLERGNGATIDTGYKQSRNSITRPNNALERGHLAPYADGIFWNWRRATNILINVVPMWKSINGQGGNWGTLENKLRDMAGSLGRELTVLSGVYEVLAYLVNNNQVPVPRYIWKFVKDGTSGIVIIIRNDPNDANDINLCQNNVCVQSGWNNSLSNMNDASKGIAVCCRVSDLKLTTANFPIPSVESNGVTGLLHFQ